MLCAITLFRTPAAAADISSEFISFCSARLMAKNVSEEAAKAYCGCAEKQRHGVLDDREQRAVNDAILGKKNAFRNAYPELNSEQIAEKLNRMDAILAGLEKKTDEVCGTPGK